jgi:hypothetical protein
VDHAILGRRRIKRSLVAIALCAAFVSCGDQNTSTNAGAPASNTSPPPASSHSVTLAWEGPTTNADNTALADLASYRIYVSTTAGQYPNRALREISAGAPGTTEQVAIDNLAAGT